MLTLSDADILRSGDRFDREPEVVPMPRAVLGALASALGRLSSAVITLTALLLAPIVVAILALAFAVACVRLQRTDWQPAPESSDADRAGDATLRQPGAAPHNLPNRHVLPRLTGPTADFENAYAWN